MAIGKHYDLDTDGTLANNSDNTIASQKAVKTYVDSKTIVDSTLSDNSENPVQNKVIKSALDNKQDTISDLNYIRTQVNKIYDKITSQDITDSGSSLPVTTDYSIGNTFLNTTDKKLYTTLVPAWQLNSNTSIDSSISIDLNTGIASGFYASSYGGSYNKIQNNSYNYSSNNPIYFHFKSSSNTSGYILSLEYTTEYVKPSHITIYVLNSKLNFSNFSYYQGTVNTIFDYQLFDTTIENNTEYYVYITYNNGEYIATLSNTGYNVNIIETTTIEESTTFSTSSIIYGGFDSRFKTYNGMEIYLLDSIGEFLVPDGALIWDSGTTLIDNTQYNDITNEKTYYYNNNILYKLAEVATSGSYNDLTDKPTIPTVNNSTITIQKNGTDVDSFTLNQSTNKSINISVPTTVAELSDSSDYVQTSSLEEAAIVAKTGSYTDLINKPTKLSDFTDDLGSDPIHTHSQYQPSGNYISYTNNTATVAGTSKTVSKTNPETLYVPDGLIMGGTAQAAGLVTRGICGVSTPTSTGAATKDNLFINYDGNNTYSSSRQLVLQAGNVGTHYGNNLYQYAAARGDAVKNYADATYAAKATSLSGYGITDAYTKTEVDGLISSVYKPAGSVAFASLPTLSDNVLGNVYNVTDAFTTTSDFVEGAGKSYPAGTNVVVVEPTSGTYKFDVLAGFVDLSGYVPTSRTINSKALSADITLTASDVGAVSTTDGVTGVVAGSTADKIDVTKNGTTSTITVDNVDNATKATQDADGNTISSTYLKLSGGTMTGGLKFASGSLTQNTNPVYMLTMDAFADGGELKWISVANIKAGKDASGNTITTTYATKSEATRVKFRDWSAS